MLWGKGIKKDCLFEEQEEKKRHILRRYVNGILKINRKNVMKTDFIGIYSMENVDKCSIKETLFLYIFLLKNVKFFRYFV